MAFKCQLSWILFKFQFFVIFGKDELKGHSVWQQLNHSFALTQFDAKTFYQARVRSLNLRLLHNRKVTWHTEGERGKSNILKTEFTFMFQRLMLDARRLTFIHRSKSVSRDCVLRLTNGTCIVRTGESAPAPCLSTSHLSSYPIHPNKYSIHWNKYKHKSKQIQTLI